MIKKLILGLLFSGNILNGCNSGPSIPPNLKQAINYVKYRSSRKGLQFSAFKSVYPDQKPSEWVEFYFSTIGAAERPSPEYFPEGENKKLGISEAPSVPDDVEIVYKIPDTSFGNQIVLRSDDEKGVIIADAYTEPRESPIGSISWKLP